MIYQRPGTPYWYAAFRVKNADGKLIKRAFSTKTTDEKEAREIERELKSKVDELREKKRYEEFFLKTIEAMTSNAIKRPGLQLSQVWERVSSDTSQSKRTERTLYQKRNVWEKFYSWIMDNYSEVTTINDVSREIAHEYMKTFKDKSSSTFNNNKNCLSSIWQVLIIPAGLKENIWRLISGAEDDSVKHRDFSIVEVMRIIAKAQGFWRYATAIGFYTGLRLKDVVHLRKSQIQGQYMTITPAKTKRNRKDVYIFIHPDLQKILDYVIAQSDPAIDYIFPDAVRDYKKKSFQSAYGKLLEKCEVKEDSRGIIGFHSLRHTFVTICESIGIDRKVLQGIVGHGSPVMTGHYSHDKESCKKIQTMPSLLTEWQEPGEEGKKAKEK